MESGVVVVRPTGRLNMTAARMLREELHAIVESGGTRVVVDLSGIEFIDSSGLGALLSGLKAARQAGGDLRIAAPEPPGHHGTRADQPEPGAACSAVPGRRL